MTRIVKNAGDFLLELGRDFKNGFMDKMLMLRAAALSYTTVLCIIPLLAVAFTVSNLLLAQMDPAETDQLIDSFLVRIIPQVQLLDEDQNQRLKSENDIHTETSLPT
ncbi:MAG: YhjD/YihY/BrkB family envelope integrity protein, partial [bacterium]